MVSFHVCTLTLLSLLDIQMTRIWLNRLHDNVVDVFVCFFMFGNTLIVVQVRYGDRNKIKACRHISKVHSKQTVLVHVCSILFLMMMIMIIKAKYYRNFFLLFIVIILLLLLSFFLLRLLLRFPPPLLLFT